MPTAARRPVHVCCSPRSARCSWRSRPATSSARGRSRPRRPPRAPGGGSGRRQPGRPRRPSRIPVLAAPRSTARTGSWASRRWGAPGTERYETTLRCERVHFARGGGRVPHGRAQGDHDVLRAAIFGPDFKVRHTVQLAGTPSRARMSPDGRRAAVTVFVSGDSYNSGGFSTRTTLIDVETGHVISDLEAFAVSKDGRRFKAIDFNYWGVTFARDGNRFFATLRSGGKNYLVEGDVDARTARVLREGVECPSLSPDNTRIVFKSRVSRLDLAPAPARSRDARRHAALGNAQRRRPGGVARRPDDRVWVAERTDCRGGRRHLDARRQRSDAAAGAGAQGLLARRDSLTAGQAYRPALRPRHAS